MKKNYICNRCGFRWRAEDPKYCLNCHSEEVSKISLWREFVKPVASRVSDLFERWKKRKTKRKVRRTRDWLLDLWRASSTAVFVVLIFILLLVFMLFVIPFLTS